MVAGATNIVIEAPISLRIPTSFIPLTAAAALSASPPNLAIILSSTLTASSSRACLSVLALVRIISAGKAMKLPTGSLRRLLIISGTRS